MPRSKTYKEGDVYYALVTTHKGHDYYIGPYPTRAKAYYQANKRQKLYDEYKF